MQSPWALEFWVDYWLALPILTRPQRIKKSAREDAAPRSVRGRPRLDRETLGMIKRLLRKLSIIDDRGATEEAEMEKLKSMADLVIPVHPREDDNVLLTTRAWMRQYGRSDRSDD